MVYNTAQRSGAARVVTWVHASALNTSSFWAAFLIIVAFIDQRFSRYCNNKSHIRYCHTNITCGNKNATSLRYSLGLHSILGLPVYPCAQVQRDVWSIDSQSAFCPQGSALQDSTQLPRRHVWLLAHSESTEHWASGGARHPLSGATRPPSGHIQATARNGSTSTILQIRPESQGFPRQRSIQRAFTQANGAKQSASVVHSVSSCSLLQPRPYGSPVRPAGHVHSARWLRAVHSASGAHDCSEHAGWQTRFSRLQICVSSQSSL